MPRRARPVGRNVVGGVVGVVIDVLGAVEVIPGSFWIHQCDTAKIAN
jgi:hypothetical protein